METETVFIDWNPDEIMTGEERYYIPGALIKPLRSGVIQSRFTGLKLYADCILKNEIAQVVIDHSCWSMVIGGLKIWNKERNGTYGFNYNPPFEFHTWLQNEKKEIIVFALPGVILRALKAKDEFGYIITGRKPEILAGMPPDWLLYSAFSRLY